MAKIAQYSFRATNLAQSTTIFHNTGIGRDFLAATGTENIVQRTTRVAGVFSHLYFRNSANSIAATPSITVTFRVNSADTALALTAGSTAVGEFEDLTHSVTVVAGDVLSIKSVTGASGANTCAQRIIGAHFAASANTVTTYYAIPSAAWATASVTQFVKFCGQGTSPTAESATQQFKSRVAGVRKNLGAQVSTNTWTTANATLKSRLNGADGALSAAVTFGVIGYYEDLTHSDTIVAGDLIDSSFTIGAGSGSFGQPAIYSDIETTDKTAQYIGSGNGSTQAPSLTRFEPCMGDIAANTTESDCQAKVGIACVADKFAIYLSSNTIVGSSTWTSRVNAGAGNGSVTISGLSAAGWYEDLTHSDTLVATDEINDSLVTGAAGTTIAYEYTGRRITASSTAALVVTTQPSTVVSGAAISPSVVITATLDGTNTDGSFTGVITAAIASGTGVLSGTLTATCVAGVATFANLIITGSGAHTLSFSAPGGFASVTSASFTVTGTLTLAFTQQPSTVASGVANSPAVTVQLSDNASGVTVTISKASGSGALTGTLTAVSNGSGLATFSNLIITGSGAHTFAAAATSYTGATSSSFTVTTPAGIVTTQPSTVVSGAVNSPAVVWKATTDGSTLDPTFTGNVTVSVASGAGAISGTLVVAAVAGVATFSNVIITIITSNAAHTLRFVASGLSNVDSASFTVTSPIQARNQAFVDAWGGDSAWFGVGDFRVNVTDDGTAKASQWDDVRGAGAGKLKPLTQATQSKRYAITGSGLVGTAAAQSHMLSALDTNLGLSQDASLSLLLVAKSPGGSQYLFGISVDPTDTTSEPYLYHATNAANWGMECNPGPSSTTNKAVLDAGRVFNDGVVRALLVGKAFRYTATPVLNGPGDAVYQLQFGGRMGRKQMSLPTANTTASGMEIALGRWGTTYADLTVSWIGITSLTLSGAFLSAFRTWATTEFGAVMDTAAKRGTIIFDDDSKIRGHNSSHPKGFLAGQDGTTSPPGVCAARNTGRGTWAAQGFETDIWALCQASNGRTVTDAVTIFSERLGTAIDTARSGPKVLITSPFNGSVVLETGVYDGAGQDVALRNAFTAYVATCVAAGFGVVVYTCTDLKQFYTPAGTGAINQSGLNAQLINTWLRSTGKSLPGVLGLVDLEGLATTHFQINRAGTHANQDTTYYDGTSHPTDVGAAELGNAFRDFFDTNDSIFYPTSAGGSLVFDSSYVHRLLRRRRAAA